METDTSFYFSSFFDPKSVRAYLIESLICLISFSPSL